MDRRPTCMLHIRRFGDKSPICVGSYEPGAGEGLQPPWLGQIHYFSGKS